MPNLSLEKSINSVEKDILEAQKERQGDLAFFELKLLDLETETVSFSGMSQTITNIR